MDRFCINVNLCETDQSDKMCTPNVDGTLHLRMSEGQARFILLIIHCAPGFVIHYVNKAVL